MLAWQDLLKGVGGLKLPAGAAGDVLTGYNNGLASIYNSANQTFADLYGTDQQTALGNAQLAQQDSEFQQRFGAQNKQFDLFQQLLGISPGGNGGNGAGAGGAPGGSFGSQLLTNSPLYEQNLADVSAMGAGQLSRIRSDFSNAGNSAVANLNARGLGASSLVSGTLNSVADRRNQAEMDLQDQLLGRKVAVRDSEMQRRAGLEGQLLGGLSGLRFL